MGTYYYVRVKAANSQGYGPTVRSSPESLNPQQAPSAPTAVDFGVTSQSMLTVSWDLPLSDGGDNITSYEVTWDKSPTFNSLELAPHKGTVKRPATERSYTIELLGLKTIYYVKVAAVNSRGAGTPQKALPQQASTPRSSSVGLAHAYPITTSRALAPLPIQQTAPPAQAAATQCPTAVLSSNSTPCSGAKTTPSHRRPPLRLTSLPVPPRRLITQTALRLAKLTTSGSSLRTK